MPNIEVSADQAAALARGESITIAPEKLRTFIVVSKTFGSIYEVKTTDDLNAFLGLDYSGATPELRMNKDVIPKRLKVKCLSRGSGSLNKGVGSDSIRGISNPVITEITDAVVDVFGSRSSF